MQIVPFIKYTLIRYPIEWASYKLNKDYDIRNTIVVSGTPRGGTTWLLELLETLPDYKSIFEPFNPLWFPKIKELIFPSSSYLIRPYLSHEIDENRLKEYLYGVFTGQFVSRQPRFDLTLEDIYKRIKARKIIVKFVRANRILPWIVENFTLRATYFLIRHPCATIASQIETGIRGYGYPTKRSLPADIVIKEASQIPSIRNNEWLMRKLHTIKSHEEVLAAIWSMDNYVPLSYLSEHPDVWYTVVYENLITDFDDEIKRVFGYINEETPEKVYEKFKKPSKTTHDKSYLGTSRQLLKWKNKLSDRQIKNILKVVHWFGLDFYTENPEPDYDALKKWKPPF